MKKKSLIYTVGYEGITAETLVTHLKKSGVEVLIDVRAVPLSRKPGLSKNRLAAHLAAAGIEYIGLKGLGTPPEGRAAARKGRTEEMRRIFAEHLKTDHAIADMADAIDIASGRRSCLLCFEHRPGTCHRAIVADIMAQKTGMAIEHLDPVPLLLP